MVLAILSSLKRRYDAKKSGRRKSIEYLKINPYPRHYDVNKGINIAATVMIVASC